MEPFLCERPPHEQGKFKGLGRVVGHLGQDFGKKAIKLEHHIDVLHTPGGMSLVWELLCGSPMRFDIHRQSHGVRYGQIIGVLAMLESYSLNLCFMLALTLAGYFNSCFRHAWSSIRPGSIICIGPIQTGKSRLLLFHAGT